MRFAAVRWPNMQHYPLIGPPRMLPGRESGQKPGANLAALLAFSLTLQTFTFATLGAFFLTCAFFDFAGCILLKFACRIPFSAPGNVEIVEFCQSDRRFP